MSKTFENYTDAHHIAAVAITENSTVSDGDRSGGLSVMFKRKKAPFDGLSEMY